MVGGKEYRYKITGDKHPYYDCPLDTRVVIEISNKKYITKEYTDFRVVTPHDIRKLIEEELDSKSVEMEK